MNRALLLALIGAVGLALGMGFSVVGGPGYARMEKYDVQRTRDLRQLERHYSCAFQEAARVDPSTGRAGCPQNPRTPDLRDPVSGAPYVFAETETGFEVCATYQTDVEARRSTAYNSPQFDGQVGCIRRRKPDVAAD